MQEQPQPSRRGPVNRVVSILRTRICAGEAHGMDTHGRSAGETGDAGRLEGCDGGRACQAEGEELGEG